MGRIRCRNCGRRIDKAFDYCPVCGESTGRLQRQQAQGSRTGLGGILIVLFTLLIIAVAALGTAWLVREKGREEVLEKVRKHRLDSLKGAEIARLRLLRERDDSLRAMADLRAERLHLESQVLTLEQLLTSTGGSVAMASQQEMIRRLRQRGYNTLRREAGGRCTVMGLNADLRGGKIAGRGGVYSVAGMWAGRVEILLSSPELADRLIDDARRWGFAPTGDTAVWRHPQHRNLMLRRLTPVKLELADRD